MKPDGRRAAQTWSEWERLSRRFLVWMLFLSAFELLGVAAVIGFLYRDPDAELFVAACLLFGGGAFAVGMAFRKIAATNWKHWLVAGAFAMPALWTTFLR